MATDTEIFRTANLLIQEYGDFAPAGAKIRADHLHALGDDRGQAVWMRVAKAAERLLSDDLPTNASVH